MFRCFIDTAVLSAHAHAGVAVQLVAYLRSPTFFAHALHRVLVPNSMVDTGPRRRLTRLEAETF
jgi:hypothetical protein